MGSISQRALWNYFNCKKGKKICHLDYSALECIIKPILLTFISISFAVSVKYLVDGINVFPKMFTLIICAGLSCGIYFTFIVSEIKEA